jgi:flavin reductase (DIM6/NTAB) family NADH-FMN oxidoreductase RutF
MLAKHKLNKKMHYDKKSIDRLDRVTRLKLINSVTGVKPGNLVGTVSESGHTNLAVFSSIVHLGSNPSLLGFISRPQTEEVGHTFRNIRQTGFYTINHIHPEFAKKAHYTSAKFPNHVSEFDACELSELYIDKFKAPFVKESVFKMGLCFKEAIDIKINGTVLVIGEIENLIISDKAFVNGDIDLEESEGVGISGLNTYYSLKKIDSYPYARLNEIPKF